MDDQLRTMNRNFGNWPPSEHRRMIVPKRIQSTETKSRNMWKGRKPGKERKNERFYSAKGGGRYKPPNLQELQFQNRVMSRKFHAKKKIKRFAPYAPLNTTSFIMRAKKSGGIASLVSPCPVTPAILLTPHFTPSREVLGDMAKQEWGVNGYGTMKGLIKLRSSDHEYQEADNDDEGPSASDVEEHVEVERRLDHDLSRFEIVYPDFGDVHSILLGNRVDNQEIQIAQLEEENLMLKKRLFLMESEMENLSRKLQHLGAEKCQTGDNMDKELENEECGDICLDQDDEVFDKCIDNERNNGIEYNSGAVQEKRVVYEEKIIGDNEKSIGIDDNLLVRND